MSTALEPEEVRQYREQGYYVPKFKFGAADVADLKSNIDRLVAGHPEFDNRSITNAFLLDPDENEYNRAFMDFCKRPELLDIAESIDGPDLILWTASVFYKQTADGYATPWHQDGAYWPIEPMAGTSVWVAATPSTRANGCLRVIPGSHKRTARHLDVGGAQFYRSLAPEEIVEADAVDLEVEAGQIILFDPMLIHGARVNTSDQERASYTLRYMPSTSWFDHDRIQDHDRLRGVTQPPYSIKTLYLVRGVNRCPRNDFTRNRIYSGLSNLEKQSAPDTALMPT